MDISGKLWIFMKKNFILYFPVLFSVLLFVSCHLYAPKTKTFTIHDKGKTVYIEKEDSFNIALDSNPATGYSWEIRPYKDSVIKFIKSKYRVKSKRIGSPGKRIIEFKALSRGRTALDLLYLRVWEKNKAPIKTFKITIVVE